MLLTIIIPVYNEVSSLSEVVDRALAVALPEHVEREIIVIDDGSTDGSADLLSRYREVPTVKVHHSVLNFGKGVAVRIGLRYASGDVVAIQDADLEYDPAEMAELIQPILTGTSTVVYGSRFLGRPHGMRFLQGWGNRVLTALTNLLYGSQLTDCYTCHKVFDRETAAWISKRLRSRGFELEAEISALLLRKGCQITELPIRYQARSHNQGKKIRARDGIVGLWTLLKLRFFAPT